MHAIDFNNIGSANGGGGEFVAVDADAASEAGAIVYFRCTTTDADRLLASCRASGLDEEKLPELPSREVALHRACDAQKAKRRLIRPVDGGWSIVDEYVTADGEELSGHVVKMTVKLLPKDQGSSGVGGTPLVFAPVEAEYTELGAAIVAEYRVQLKKYAAADISMWLVRLVESLHAVSPRDRGGFYFVPKCSLEILRRWTGMLHGGSDSRVMSIPAMRSDEAVEAILDAITREAEAEAEGMENELAAIAESEGEGESEAEARRKPIGRRAIQSRLGRLQGLGGKLGVYEDLLGVKLEEVRARLERVRAGMVVAHIAATEA